MPGGRSLELKNAVILIAGASTGIGAATAKLLAGYGAKIALVARSADKLIVLAESIGDQAFPITADLTIQADVERMAKEAVSHFGHLDAVYVNAGTFVSGNLMDGDPEVWAAGINLNITALLRVLRVTLPYLANQRFGHVLVTSSVAGHRWMKGQTVYCATKNAVAGIILGLRFEMLEYNVKVTSITPGWVASELWDNTPDVRNLLKSALLNREAISSEDIANAVIYALTQPDSVNINEIIVQPLKQMH